MGTTDSFLSTKTKTTTKPTSGYKELALKIFPTEMWVFLGGIVAFWILGAVMASVDPTLAGGECLFLCFWVVPYFFGLLFHYSKYNSPQTSLLRAINIQLSRARNARKIAKKAPKAPAPTVLATATTPDAADLVESIARIHQAPLGDSQPAYASTERVPASIGALGFVNPSRSASLPAPLASPTAQALPPLALQPPLATQPPHTPATEAGTAADLPADQPEVDDCHGADVLTDDLTVSTTAKLPFWRRPLFASERAARHKDAPTPDTVDQDGASSKVVTDDSATTVSDIEGTQAPLASDATLHPKPTWRSSMRRVLFGTKLSDTQVTQDAEPEESGTQEPPTAEDIVLRRPNAQGAPSARATQRATLAEADYGTVLTASYDKPEDDQSLTADDTAPTLWQRVSKWLTTDLSRSRE